MVEYPCGISIFDKDVQFELFKKVSVAGHSHVDELVRNVSTLGSKVLVFGYAPLFVSIYAQIRFTPVVISSI